MPAPTRPIHRVAIASFHSMRNMRGLTLFRNNLVMLQNRELVLASGDLRQDGIDNDLVLAIEPAEAHLSEDFEPHVVEVLSKYDAIVYQHTWDLDALRRIRAQLGDRMFIRLGGGNQDDGVADVLCSGPDNREALPSLVAHLVDPNRQPSLGALEPMGARWQWLPVRRERPARAFTPNLHPVMINAEALPGALTYWVQGNHGCAYQSDVRENPYYKGVRVPAEYSHGCSLCPAGHSFRPNRPAVAVEKAMEELRWFRKDAPEIEHLVLKDQHPMLYLAELVEAAAAEGLSGFTLFIETRADWLLRSAERFERALDVAEKAGIRIALYLVGIESFSQPELDRYNKGVTPQQNIDLLALITRWREQKRRSLDLDQCMFGFVMFSPWTTMEDLRANLEGVRRSRFDTFQGSMLRTRIRLYRDTSLFYLAEHDGVFIGKDEGGPTRDWRFQHEDVAHFGELAEAMSAQTGGCDDLRVFESLMDAFDRAPDFHQVTLRDVANDYAARRRKAGRGPQHQEARAS